MAAGVIAALRKEAKTHGRPFEAATWNKERIFQSAKDMWHNTKPGELINTPGVHACRNDYKWCSRVKGNCNAWTCLDIAMPMS